MSEEHYPDEADEAATDGASCMEPMTPRALTREQVDKAFLGLYQEQHIKGNIGVTTTLILLHSHITQQVQEAGRLRNLIQQVVNALPTKRDWLDPALENALRGE